MARTEFDILQKQWDGTQYEMVTIATATEIEYHGEWMGDEYVLVTVKSEEPVDFKLGDMMMYRGEQYRLMDDPNVVKKARRGSYGEGFTYSNIKFYSVGHYLQDADFKDVVLDDNKISYTSLSEFSFFAGSVEDLADRLQANLNRFGQEHEASYWRVFTPNKARFKERFGIESDNDPWVEEWEAYYPGTSGDTVGETDVNINVTKDQGCWDLLKMSYSQFGLSFYQRGYDIIIGAPEVRPGHIFRYGKGNGLAEIERTSDDGQELVTKVWGYGSETNMPLNYYANLYNKYKAKVVEIPEHGQLRRTFILDIANSGTYFTDRIGSYNAFNVEVECNRWTGTQKATIAEFYDNNPAPTGCCYLVTELDIPSLDPNVEVYFVGGIDKNNWPTDEGHTEHIEGYPSLLSINRLMLPGFPKMSLYDWILGVGNGSISGAAAGGLTQGDARYIRNTYDLSQDPYDPWIRSKNAATVGSIEGSVFFDGSQMDEIMPTIENTQAGVVTRGSIITDNGYLEKDGETFDIQVAHDDALNWRDVLNTAPDKDGVVVSMTDGYCTGRDFKVIKATEGEYEQDNYWELELERSKDGSIDRYFPYNDSYVSGYCQIRVGDTFVVTGIQMPDSYIIAASVKLLMATCGWLDRRDHVRYTYVPKIDEIYMARQHASMQSGSLHDTLKAGMQLQLEDSDLGIERYTSGIHTSPYIDTLTIKEGSGPVPTYDVVLRDEKEKGYKESMTESMNELRSTIRPQVTERQRRSVEYIEYESWNAEAAYYYETLNVDENRLETSRVRHHGVLYECRRSFTHEEPHYGATDWVVIDNSEPYFVIEKSRIAGGVTPNSTIAYGETMYISAYVRFGGVNLASTIQSVVRDDGWNLPVEKITSAAFLTVKWKDDNGEEAKIAFDIPFKEEYFTEESHEVTLIYNGVEYENVVMYRSNDGLMKIDLRDPSIDHPEWFKNINDSDRMEFTDGFNYTKIPGDVMGYRMSVSYNDCFVTGRNASNASNDNDEEEEEENGGTVVNPNAGSGDIINPAAGQEQVQSDIIPINPEYPCVFAITSRITSDGKILSDNFTLKAQKRSLKDMGAWRGDVLYALMFDRDDDLAERVYPTVWHNGILWQLAVSRTNREPKWGCTEWTPIGGDANYYCEITSSAGTTFRNGDVNTVLTMDVLFGQEDITTALMAVEGATVTWSRYTGWDDVNKQFIQTPEDLEWHAHEGAVANSIVVVRNDMGSGWMHDYRQGMFRCNIYVPEGDASEVTAYSADFIQRV